MFLSLFSRDVGESCMRPTLCLSCIYCNVAQMHLKILRHFKQVFIVYLYLIFGIPICNTQAILSHLHYIAIHQVLFQVIGELG